MPDSIDVHVDAVLSQFAIQYKNERTDLIGDRVSPPVKVVKESDKYIIYTKKDRFTVPSTYRADKDTANEVYWGKDTEGTYQCIEYALRDIASDRAIQNADKPLDMKRDTQEFLEDLILLDREVRLATQLFSTTTFASYYSTLGTADQWSNFTSDDSDPLDDVETARESIRKNAMKRMNTLIMGYEVYKQVRHHPLVVDRVKGGATVRVPAVIGATELAQVFDVDQVLIGSAIYNSANIGQTMTAAFIWGKYVLGAYINPQPMSIKNVTMALSPMSQDFMTRTYRDEPRRGTWIEPSQIIDELVPCDACGYLFNTAVA